MSEKCIDLRPDNLGNLIAAVNEDICIKCNKCIRACPANEKPQFYEPICCYAAWDENQERRKSSSSGGVTGAMANIVLNIILIPYFGAVGAAVASLITQFFTNVIVGFILKAIRRNNKLMVESLHPKYIISTAKMLFRKL